MLLKACQDFNQLHPIVLCNGVCHVGGHNALNQCPILWKLAIPLHARDKDAIVATMALCEAAAYYKTKGMTLWDAMVIS